MSSSVKSFSAGLPPVEVVGFIIENYEHLTSQTNALGATDPFWFSIQVLPRRYVSFFIYISMLHSSIIFLDSNNNLKPNVFWRKI